MTDLQSNFSHTLHSHLYGSSGFTYEDCLCELFHNSFDANSTIVNIELINNEYLLISDNGEGSDDPLRFFNLGTKLIKKEKNKIGKKNIGFLGTTGTLIPESILILTLKKDEENVKSLKYKSGEHIQKIKDIDKAKEDERDYKQIQIGKFFEHSVFGSWNSFIEKNNLYISESTKNIYKKISNNLESGTIILFKLTNTQYIQIDNIITCTNNDDNDISFIKKISITTKKINMINFYKNGKTINKNTYIDILNSKYQTIIGNYTFIKNDSENCYLCKEVIMTDIYEFTTNYIKISLITNRSDLIDKNKYEELIENEEFLGDIDIGYQLWNEDEWNKLDFETNDGKRLLIYDCFDGKYRFFGKSRVELQNSSVRNHGPYLSFIKINENNIDFAEKYLGMMNNKSKSSSDTFDPYIRKILIDRFRHILIYTFSRCQIYTEYEEFLKENKYPLENISKGIIDWLKYKDLIKDIFSRITKTKVNYLILEYKQRNNISINNIKILEKKNSTISKSIPIQTVQKRQNFSNNVIKEITKQKGNCCHITHIPNSLVTPTERDHNDGNRNNNSSDNLNQINIGLHRIKTLQNEEYKKIIKDDESICKYMVDILYNICSSDKLITYLKKNKANSIKTDIDELFKKINSN